MLKQDVEKVRQLCSRIAQRLHVRLRVRVASLLAAAALDGLFDHPAGARRIEAIRQQRDRIQRELSQLKQ